MIQLLLACHPEPLWPTVAYLDSGRHEDSAADTGTPGNQGPTATDDVVAVGLGATTVFDVLANDTDPDDGIDPASLAVVGLPLHGLLTVGAEGALTYVHDGSADPVDGWSYTVADRAGQRSAAATVTLTVSGPEPIAGAPSATSEELDHPAAAAVDGDPTTRWTSPWSARGGDAITLDLGGWFRLTGISAALGPDGASGADSDFSLQIWDGCWQTVPGGEVHGNSAVAVDLPVDAVTRRIRYVCTAIGGTCTVRELGVRGVPDAAPTTPLACAAGTMRPARDPDYAQNVFLPVGYDRNTLYPTVFSYHGIGGATLDPSYTAVSTNPEGVPYRLAFDPAFAAGLDAIVIAPHCRTPYDGSSECWFDPDAMERMFLRALGDWNVDPDRVSVTGLSGGGIRGWELLIRQRERVAAFVPIASDLSGPYTVFDGYGAPVPASDGRHFCDLRDVPIDAYHGTSDTVVSYTSGRATPDLDLWMATRCDATVDVFGFDPNDFLYRGHDVWNDVYANDAVWAWLLAQRVSARPAP